MKKKLLAILSILLIAAMLAACGNSVPKGFTQEVYDIGCDALNIMEKYNNAEISKDDAEDRLSALYTKISNMPDLTDVIENANKGLVEIDIFQFKSSLGFNDGKTYDIENELRNTLNN